MDPLSRYKKLPPDVYGGDVFLDETGSALIIYGIDGKVHIVFGDTMARSLTPRMALSVANQIIDAAERMENFPQRQTDEATIAAARWSMPSTERPDARKGRDK